MTDSGNPSDLQFPVSPEPRDFDVTHVVDKDALEFPSMDDDPSHAAAHESQLQSAGSANTAAIPAPPVNGHPHDHARRTARSGAHDATPTPDETPADSAALTLAATQPLITPQPSVGRHAANTVNGAPAGNAAPTQLFTSPHDDVLAGVSVNPPLPAEEPTRVVSSEWEQIVDSQTSVMPPAAPAAMPPAIPPTDADGNADGSGDEPGEEAPHHSANGGGKSHTKLIAGIVVGVLVIALIAGGIAWWSSSRRNNAQRNAYTLCQNTRDSYDDAHTALAAALKDANALTSTPTDQVADAKTLDTLKSAVADAEKLDQQSVAECAVDANTAAIEKTTDSLRNTANEITKAKSALDAATKAVNDSKNMQSQSAARDELTKAIDDAQKILDASANAVTDEQVRTDLENRIADARKLADGQNLNAEDVTAMVKTLTDAGTAVQQSQTEYANQQAATAQQAAEEAQRQAEAQAQAAQQAQQNAAQAQQQNAQTTTPDTSDAGTAGDGTTGTGATGTDGETTGNGGTPANGAQ